MVQDVEATTTIRESSRIQRYVDWVAERPGNPLALIIAGTAQDDVDTSEDQDQGVVVACHNVLVGSPGSDRPGPQRLHRISNTLARAHRASTNEYLQLLQPM